jgi:hypothetical protein
VALYIAARDPRVPRHVKLAATAIAAYALSPVDLISITKDRVMRPFRQEASARRRP